VFTGAKGKAITEEFTLNVQWYGRADDPIIPKMSAGAQISFGGTFRKYKNQAYVKVGTQLIVLAEMTDIVRSLITQLPPDNVESPREESDGDIE
jgi:hypothetical protein